MLYDKRWDKPEIKTNPFSLDHLIEWLESQSADATYDWHDCRGACLIGIYFAAHGHEWSSSKYINFADYRTRQLIAGTKPFTFGAALKRARTFASSTGERA